jgi:hypothetical protein
MHWNNLPQMLAEEEPSPISALPAAPSYTWRLAAYALKLGALPEPLIVVTAAVVGLAVYPLMKG